MYKKSIQRVLTEAEQKSWELYRLDSIFHKRVKKCWDDLTEKQKARFMKSAKEMYGG